MLIATIGFLFLITGSIVLCLLSLKVKGNNKLNTFNIGAVSFFANTLIIIWGSRTPPIIYDVDIRNNLTFFDNIAYQVESFQLSNIAVITYILVFFGLLFFTFLERYFRAKNSN
jgi:hypothetical protein